MLANTNLLLSNMAANKKKSTHDNRFFSFFKKILQTARLFFLCANLFSI
ncbi:hypothetical protein PRUB_a0433 [Pseudoalteromonas rubra]|uniref:Uncharacterized protein n=1 Tax=Pseudoalteromonas rubra TaxID=43658 RepID=A0A8T0C5W3_9GAMM|nr:hypothetical protein PRUB_a0433 [Pseudoalteromonas rubra]